MIDSKAHIGQMFIIGFSGAEPSPEFLEFVKKEHIGGVIFFSDNCPSHEQISKNIALIKEACLDNQPFIAVDQEGGRVSRISGAPIEIKNPFEYGQHFGLEKFIEDYQRSMLYLESFGFNINLAPVCDIFSNADNSCLEGRCFGETPELVAEFVAAAVKISEHAGIQSCLKHFPGLGSSSIDPHHEISFAQYDLDQWRQQEKIPFESGIQQGAELVMTTHVKIPKLDNTIVTGSKNIIDKLLRQDLNYNGLLITDDLSMAGASDLGDIGQRTLKAFEAGHDLLLFGQNFEDSKNAYKYLSEEIASGAIDNTRLNSTLLRISGLKFKLGKPLTI